MTSNLESEHPQPEAWIKEVDAMDAEIEAFYAPLIAAEEAMKAKMLAEGGSRETAREIYTRMYEQSTDDKVKDMARKRLLQLDSLDQRDSLRKLFAAFQARAGRCPTSWKELDPLLRALRVPLDASGAPLDPSGVPYVLRAGACEVDLDPKSEIPVK